MSKGREGEGEMSVPFANNIGRVLKATHKKIENSMMCGSVDVVTISLFNLSTYKLST